MELVYGCWCYGFDDLPTLVARVTRDEGSCLPPTAVKKAAKMLGMRVSDVQKALEDGGMPRQLSVLEMVGRTTFDGGTVMRHVGVRYDSKGSVGRVYDVAWPGSTTPEYEFVHSSEQTAAWYHAAGSAEAAAAVTRGLNRPLRG